MDYFLGPIIYAVILSPLIYLCYDLLTREISFIAKCNANGKYTDYMFSYSRSEVEAAEHIKIQSQMAEHTDGDNPFYCNTFTGLRKHLYSMFYNKELKKNERLKRKEMRKQPALKQKQKKADKALSAEMKRVSTLDLQSRMEGNMKDRKTRGR